MDKEKYYGKQDLIALYDECQDLVTQYQELIQYYHTRCDFAEKPKSEEEYKLDEETLSMIYHDASVLGKTIDDKIEDIELLIAQ
tara:strand:- start:382 stop:633 length:252 start_codon:yes stop_codon:yes gene_type:complete